MLRLSDGTILPLDDYSVIEKYNGINQLSFTLPETATLSNEESVVDTNDAQKYLVKVVNGDKITCELDLDDLQASQPDFDNSSATPLNTATAALTGTGWSVVDTTGVLTRRTIRGALTPLAVIAQIEATWDGVTASYNNHTKTVTLVLPSNNQPSVTFLTEALNLRQLDIAGDSSGFCTRLRAKGSEGLTFASINDGKDYVENNTYSSRVIYGTPIEDDRFKDAQSLKDYAQAVLDANAIPAVSYSCDVIDLAAIDNTEYNFLSLSMHKAVWLLDKRRNTKVAHRVVQYERHPLHPDRNKVTLSTVTQTLQSSVGQLRQAMQDPNSPDRSRQQAAISNATGWITGANGGYVVFKRNEAGQPIEILIMDTDSTETAQKVWRWNLGGFAYSSTGVNGPYTTAITQDGSIVADFITAGTLSANRVRTGLLESDNGRSYFDLTESEFFNSISRILGVDYVKLTDGSIVIGHRDGADDDEVAYFGADRSFTNNSCGSFLLQSLYGGTRIGGSTATGSMSVTSFDDDNNSVSDVTIGAYASGSKITLGISGSNTSIELNGSNGHASVQSLGVGGVNVGWVEVKDKNGIPCRVLGY